MTGAEIQAEIDALKAQQGALKAQLPKPFTMKVGDKGGVSVYMGSHFPVTLYAAQWEHLTKNIDKITAFIAANNQYLSRK